MKYTAKTYVATGLICAVALTGGLTSISAQAAETPNMLTCTLEPQTAGCPGAVVEADLVALPGDKTVSLTWTPITVDDTLVTKYQILYGEKSVEEALADSYDTVQNIDLDADTLETVGVAKMDIPKLTNGTKYFFAIRAILPDGSKSKISAEAPQTPSAESATPATTPTDVENTELQLSEAMALTTTIIKVTLSKNIVLPEDEEVLKASFTVNLKNDEDTTLEIENVVLRDNYYLDSEDTSAVAATDDDEIYITVKDALTVEKDYQVTVSARVKDVDGKAIENGVVDNFVFQGTDSLEIPIEEKLGETEAVETAIVETTATEENLKGAPTEEVEETVLPTVGEEDLKAAPNDKAAPEDASNLTYKLQSRVKDFVVNLSWTKSKNSAGDAIKQLFYVSLDEGKTWGAARTLPTATEEYKMSATADKTYTVKVTTQDRSGNESKGVIKTIKIPELVSSGAPIFMALGMAFMGGGFLSARRREEA